MPRGAAIVATAAVGLGLAACGGSSSSTSPSASSSSATSTSTQTSTPTQTSSTASTRQAAAGASIAADPSGQLKFTKASLSAKAGKVTIAFTNSAPLVHNLTIQQGTNGAMIGATPTFQGGTKSLTVNLKSGTYTFYCSVPGHRQAGMHGTLTVN